MPVKITSVTSTTLTVFIPRGIDGQTYTFTMASPVTGNTFLKTFTLKKTSTPTMTLTSASSVAAGSISVSLNRTNLATVLPSSITLVSKINPNDVIIVTANSWTNTTTVINFNVVVKSGLYGFVVAYPNYGIASITATLTVTSAALTLAGPVTTSFNGGSLTITGAGMSPSGYITVNGLRGNILSANDAGTTFTIPTLVTDATLQTFNFATPSNLPMGQFTFISDTLPNSNVQNAFDGNLQSTYVSTNP